MPRLQANFTQVLADHTAGDPQRENVRWTDLTRREIAEHLQERGTPVSEDVVGQLLDQQGYVKRKAQKSLAMRSCPQRNEQFENIARLRTEYLDAGQPVVSMDTKKKELLGNFFRPGALYARKAEQTFDHDFPSFSEGVVIPHGLYDIRRNVGHLSLGTSHDTSEFACDSLKHWWLHHGTSAYPAARSLLLLCDGGGSNNSQTYLFKQHLQALVDEIGLEIRVAHYPPYCSKYNPIEHRLFPHVTRACQGVVFRTLDLVRQLMQKTHTSTGLRVTVDILDRVYQTGQKACRQFRETMRIVFDEYLPKWNYTAVPVGRQKVKLFSG